MTVTAAQDLPQQLAQGFASGQSPDVFYVSGDNFATYAKAGNLLRLRRRAVERATTSTRR